MTGPEIYYYAIITLLTGKKIKRMDFSAVLNMTIPSIRENFMKQWMFELYFVGRRSERSSHRKIKTLWSQCIETFDLREKKLLTRVFFLFDSKSDQKREKHLSQTFFKPFFRRIK
jgi:hypothetical protein